MHPITIRDLLMLAIPPDWSLAAGGLLFMMFLVFVVASERADSLKDLHFHGPSAFASRLIDSFALRYALAAHMTTREMQVAIPALEAIFPELFRQDCDFLIPAPTLRVTRFPILRITRGDEISRARVRYLLWQAAKDMAKSPEIDIVNACKMLGVPPAM